MGLLGTDGVDDDDGDDEGDGERSTTRPTLPCDASDTRSGVVS
jgi:hypothetical protein